MLRSSPSSEEPMEISVAKDPIVISLYCNKGGVGKTTLAHNLAYILATEYDLKVLAVDADPQCNLSSSLLKTPHPSSPEGQQLPPDLEELVYDFYHDDARPREVSRASDQRHIYDCFKPLININAAEEGDFFARVKHVKLRKTAYDNLYLLPGHLEFTDADTAASSSYLTHNKNDVGKTKTFAYLSNYLRHIGKVNNFDVILLDLNPGMSILNANYILTSDYFVLPIYPDGYSLQGISGLCKKISEWVPGMEFYRNSELADFMRLGKPAKFLGYAVLRYPVHKQKKGKPDVVTAYAKWWEKIHAAIESTLLPTLRNMQADGEPSPMVREKFKLFRFGIKDFASLGKTTQETGRPIAEVLSYASTEEMVKRRFFNQQFKRLIAMLLGNMDASALHKLGFADIDNFRLSTSIFGPIKSNDVHVEKRLDFGNESLDFRIYSNPLDPEQCDLFCKLPIPNNPREISKAIGLQLDLNSRKTERVLRYLKKEIFYYALAAVSRESRDEMLNFWVQQSPRNRNDHEKKIISDLEKYDRIRNRNRKKRLRNTLLNQIKDKDCRAYLKVIESAKCSFTATGVFNPEQQKHLLKAILLSMALEGNKEKYRLVIWEESPEGNYNPIFDFPGDKYFTSNAIRDVPKYTNELHVLMKDGSFYAMLPKRQKRLEDITRERLISQQPYDNVRIDALLRHYIGYNDRNYQIIPTIKISPSNVKILKDRLSAILDQLKTQRRSTRDNINLIIPLLFTSTNHGTLLWLEYSRNPVNLPKINYYDPMGEPIPNYLFKALKDLHPNLTRNDIYCSDIAYQDNYGFGSMIIEIARAIYKGEPLPDVDLNTNKLCLAHRQILNDATRIDGLIYQSIPGDGHCLFHAVGLYLGETQAWLRRIVAAHIEHNLDDFRDFLARPDGKTVTDYIEDVRKGKEWASHVEIEVLMRLLDRPIMVVNPEGSLVNDQDAHRFTGEPIFVYYTDNHYDSLILDGTKDAESILRDFLSDSQQAAREHSPQSPRVTGFLQRSESPRLGLFGIPSSPSSSDKDTDMTTTQERRYSRKRKFASLGKHHAG